MKLYEITAQYQNIYALLQNPEFAENEDILTALDQIEDAFENKAQQTIFMMKNIEAEIDPIDTEIKRLQAMKKARQNNIDRIKNRLRENMKAVGMSKLNCGLFSLSYRLQEANAVELDETEFLANNLDEDLVTVKVTPNKTEIKRRLKNGEEIIGARLVDSEVLTIR
ncbi:siphovirus Gp157 family protein [Haemophilus sp. Marseille-Q0026]|jgi:hypothetical protein|uniref:siphovirus Gp157 family protein n=1 Tax=Haemophilus sp. Marseille-Q0026 TaxID=2866580 RepID=UPI001CF80350|nr:siphovirus Gp157 family protein [Haemophilus sp. Marseille-Q0026]DAQ59266.1 MAG TPA: resistance protein [Caudoviricetes sp.]DAW81246.1 MAG TPA: resistance protein [Caudoviricetes sp.]